MNIENLNQAERLFMYLGEIDDNIIAEAEAILPAFQATGKKKRVERVVKYSTIVVGISGVVAAAYFLSRIRTKKKRASNIAA